MIVIKMNAMTENIIKIQIIDGILELKSKISNKFDKTKIDNTRNKIQIKKKLMNPKIFKILKRLVNFT